jgi:hypothetical protein
MLRVAGVDHKIDVVVVPASIANDKTNDGFSFAIYDAYDHGMLPRPEAQPGQWPLADAH